MNEAVSPLSVVASGGMWCSDALVKNYTDLAVNVETNFKQLPREDFDSESDMEVPPFCGLRAGAPFAGRVGRISHGHRGFV